MVTLTYKYVLQGEKSLSDFITDILKSENMYCSHP